MTMTSRPTSLSDSGVQLSPEAMAAQESSRELSLISSLAECDDNSKAMSKKEKYFAEKPDKNIFKKFIHPSYHERNGQFKKIFVDKGLIEENDQFLASYSCAYQREILAQGRMFISQFNVCFYANIIGWETTLVIPMKEIKLVKKMKAAFIFPNSIQIERDTAEKYFFASFINRDKSFQVLTTAHEKVVQEGKAMTREEVWDMVYNSEDKNSSHHHTPPETGTPASIKNTSTENMTVLSTRSLNGTHTDPKDKDSASQSSSSTTSDFHEEDVVSQGSLDEEVPAQCPCTEHTGKVLMNREVKMSVEKFFELVFTETPFLTEFNERYFVGDYVAATWVRDHQGENTRTCAYTVSLNNPMAPKAINVNEKQVLNQFPIPRQGFVLTKETQNSGVPFADNFTVNCKYCISRTGPTSCKVKVHGELVYKKSPWGVVKGFIEKGTYGGLDDHYKLLNEMMDEYLKKNPDGGSAPPPNIIPALPQPVKHAEESSSKSQIRHRNTHKTVAAPERLMAGGENSSKLHDDDFVAEMRPREVPVDSFAIRSSSLTSKSTGFSGFSFSTQSEYSPFLIAIIALLALFLISNLYVLQGLRSSVTVPEVKSPKEENLMEMMSMLMEQMKELKAKVDTMQKEK